jgi:hypothetical protein
MAGNLDPSTAPKSVLTIQIRRCLVSRALTFLVPAILLGILVAASTPLTGCSGGGGPAGPGGENLCGRISFSNNPASISVSSGACAATTGGFTNHVFDQFGRILSFDFDITCTSNGERLVGRVFNITYNNVGTILSLQATINGRACSLP